MTILIHRMLCALILGVLVLVSSPALAQQDCADTVLETGPTFTTGPDCTISWIDHNQIHTLTRRAVKDDFETAKLEQTLNSTTLTSSQLPELIDVDRDGWLDLVTFTPAGMVNGIFDVFLFEAAGGFYKPGQSLFGHTLSRDRDDYLIVAGRNGPGTVMRFFTIKDQMLRFAFEIDPYAIDPAHPDGLFACDVSVTSSGGSMQDEAGATGALPENTDLLQYYCEPEPSPLREKRHTDLEEDPKTSDRVPAGTVFYCRLEGCSHKVTISHSAEGLQYAYGPVAGEPELVLNRPAHEVAVLPLNGAGPSRFGQVGFDNGAYTYTTYYRYDPLIGSNPMRGLVVTKDGDAANPVFAKDCIADHAYDAIATFEPR